MAHAVATQTLDSAIESALIHGDLAQLNPAGRLEYYRRVCESLGLNPLTQPFAYITLNGKLQLYAKRDCAEQLRKVHGVSVTSMKNELIGGIYTVTVSGKDKHGREDFATGAVPIEGIKGESLANAYLKAETKAKRRLTLSICGLGLLDETEVASIPDAKPFVEPPQPSLVTRQLEASCKVEGIPVPTPKPAKERDEEDVFIINEDRVVCVPLEVTSKTAKSGRPFVTVMLNGDIEYQGAKLSSAFCYDTKFFDVLKTSVEKESSFRWTVEKGFLKITDVYRIDGVEYSPEPREPQPIDDIPF